MPAASIPWAWQAAGWSISHPARPQGSQHCGFCSNKWSLVTVRGDYYNLIIGLALMVHSVLLRDEKEYSPRPLETAVQMRREKTGNPEWGQWKRLQSQDRLSEF